VIQVTPTLFRGPRPNSLKELRDAGIETIISLESGVYELFHDDEFEREYPSDFGMRHYDLPCSDVFPPEESTVQKAISIALRGNKTYIHCLSGVDRTGFVVAAYQMQVGGRAYRFAYEEWKRMGRHWWFDWWRFALKRWEKK
jgi:protein-tyrosine phosphatase